jgi:hypothetical protein
MTNFRISVLLGKCW